MPNILVHSPNDSVSISGQALQRLLDHGNGDAALLYLALLRKHGALPPRPLPASSAGTVCASKPLKTPSGSWV